MEMSLVVADTPRDQKWAERVHRYAHRLAAVNAVYTLDTARNAVRARDAKLLRVLRDVTEQIDRVSESQYGQTRRGTRASVGERAEQTERAYWRNALEFAERGEVCEPCAWMLAAAALEAGLINMAGLPRKFSME